MELQSYSRMKAWGVSFVLGCLILTTLAAAQSMPSQATSFLASGTFRLTVTERDLSLDAREASLAAILAEIGQRTKIPIVIMSPSVDERITIHLSLMPLDKALKQLTPNVAIATAQGPNAPPHRIAKVYVLPKGRDRMSQLAHSATSPETSVSTDAGGSTRMSAAQRPAPKTIDAGESATSSAAARPAPFQFTFDPSQHMKQSQ